jgi:hypothetical protein
MNEHADPLDYLIQCCETAIETGKWRLNKFTVSNAKDELKRLRESKRDLSRDAFEANKNSVDDSNRWLSCERELVKLKEKIKTIFSQPVAYGLINDRYDIYDLRISNNPYNNQDNVVPLYSNKPEFIEWLNDSKSKK